MTSEDKEIYERIEGVSRELGSGIDGFLEVEQEFNAVMDDLWDLYIEAVHERDSLRRRIKKMEVGNENN